jgi:hypothetical protein
VSEGNPIIHPMKIGNLSLTFSTLGPLYPTFYCDRAVAMAPNRDMQYPDVRNIQRNCTLRSHLFSFPTLCFYPLFSTIPASSPLLQYLVVSTEVLKEPDLTGVFVTSRVVVPAIQRKLPIRYFS